MGKGTNTTTTQQSANPTALAAYNQALGYAGQAYNQTAGQTVPTLQTAGINAQQNLGIGGINQYANSAQPAIGQAEGLINNAANPLTAGQIQNYYDPYQQNVINATEAQFNNQNAQQQQQVLGNAAAQGALGGDRVGVAQANLAGQQQIAQAPVIAGLESQGYNQALQTAAQQYQQNPMAAAYGLAGTGVAGQNAGLQGAGAQFGVGTAQQQTAQVQNAAQYQQAMQQFYLPEQLAQAYAGQAGSLGPLYGGTSSTTGPSPSIWSQLLGAGIAGVGAVGGTGGFGQNGWATQAMSGVGSAASGAAGGIGSALSSLGPLALMAKRGGRIERDAGGSAGVSDFDLPGLRGIQLPAAHNQFASLPPPPKAADPSANMTPITSALGSLRWNNNNTAGQTKPYTGQYSQGDLGGTAGPLYTPQTGGLYARGGEIRIPERIRRDMGGPLSQAGYGTGSFVLPFEDRWAGVGSSPQAPDDVPDAYFDEKQTEQLGLGKPVNWAPNDNGASVPDRPGVAPLPPARSIAPARGYNDDDAALPLNATPTGGDTDYGISAAPNRYPGTWEAGGAGWNGLMAAGLGMMASRSPFPGVAIGEGGLQGLQAFGQERQQQLKQRSTDAQIEDQRKRLELMAKQELDKYSKMTPYETGHLDIMQRQQRLAELKPEVVTDPSTGMPHPMVRDQATEQLLPIDPRTGQVTRPGDIPQGAAPPAQGANPLLQNQHRGFQNVGWQVDPGMEYLAQPASDEIPKTAHPEVLQGVDEGLAARVRAVDEGRMPLPTGAAQRMPQNIALLELLSRYDPGFTAQDYATKLATRRDFTAGPTAKNITALNTVMQHVKELDGAAGDLNNWKSSSLGPLTKNANALTNWYRQNEQDPRLSHFNTAADAVATELERAFRGNTTALGGIQEWRSHLHPAMSPEEWQAARGTLMKLLGGRIEAVTDQYNRGMGTAKDPMMMLSPGAAQAYKELQSPQRPGQQQGAAPPTQRQIGQTVTTSKGTFRWNGSGWDPVTQ